MAKQNYAFEFLEQYSSEWAVIASDFEKLLFTNIDSALIQARKLSELIVKNIYSFEEMEYPSFSNQAEKLMMLKQNGIIDEELFKFFDRIRRMGNIAAHENNEIPLSDGLKVHGNLYQILKWFMESYVSFEVEVPEYQNPKPENIDEKISSKFKMLLQELLPEYLNNSQPIISQESELQTNVESVIDEFPKLHDSRLLFQLSKLRESSQDAVEGYKGLSDFKKYLHIKRPIEEMFEKYLMECAEASKSKLILLCGSVGDGKSHLFSYMSTKIPDIMSQFKIHNDATESFDPKKNSLDTLSEVLEAFSDSQLENSQEKMILAINLGVLNNFIESHYAKEKYQKLKEFIMNANIFDSNSITNPEEHHHFKLLNFSDYKSFELTKDGPVSKYLTDLFQKITQPTDDNPFYQAYVLDKQEQLVNPLLINYEMFSSVSVQSQIIQLIIETIIKDKVIISSRALLNFIYDILVPSTIEEIRTSDFIDMLPSLLPNLLFEGIEKSPILRMVANHDPIHIRVKELDEKLISLNNAGNYYMFFRDVIYDPSAQGWINLLENLEEIAFLDKDTKRELSELFIRASFLYESHLKQYFTKIVYEKYMKFLYAYNTGKKVTLQDLYYEIQKAIYLWKGSPKNNYIYIDKEAGNIRIAEPLKLKSSVITSNLSSDEIVERFTITLVLGFKCEPLPEVHEVEIDFPLYEMVGKVLNGYRLNKKNREDSIKFIDFIEKLLPYGRQKEEIFIKDMENQSTFILRYDEEFEAYTFSKES